MLVRVRLVPTSEKMFGSCRLLAGSEIIWTDHRTARHFKSTRAKGMTEGVKEAFKDATLPKFRPGGLLLVHAGGPAGLFSAIIGGWVNGVAGSDPVTKLVSI